MSKLSSPGQLTSAHAHSERMALRVIASWERGTNTLDYILQGAFQRSKLSPQDKARVTEWVYNWGRGRGSARYLLEDKLSRGLDSLPAKLRRRLELCVCRLLYEERTPKEVIVSGAVDAVKGEYGTALGNVANAVLRKIAADPLPWPDEETDPVAHLAHSTSHPAWIVERWLRRWGKERTEAQLKWNNLRPSIWLRWNALQGDRDKAVAILHAADVEFEEAGDFANYYRLTSSFYPRAASLVQSGYFSVQDPSASLAVSLLNPKPGMEILDLCAAPGGKTTLMAEMSGGDARITALDSSGERLKQLEKSLKALNIPGVQAIVADARRARDNSHAKASRPEVLQDKQFDAVLADVPCSGFGVLGRRADLRWRRKPEDIADLVKLQKELIRAAARCTRPGGVMVYSTCTTEPEENGEIVRDFRQNNGDFTLDEIPEDIPDRFKIGRGEIATYSPRDGVDGIYAARLARKSDES